MGFEHFPWLSRWLEDERGSRLTPLPSPSPTPEERAHHRAQRRGAIAFFDPLMPDSATIASGTAGPLRRMQHTGFYNRIARPVVAPLSLIEDYDEAYAGQNPGELPPRLYERLIRRERQLTYKPGQKITFMTLPPEIRNHIYDFAYASDHSTPLKDLKLPLSLYVPGIFTEAISFFFANTPVSMTFRSNWCVRYQHLHTPTHIRYASTGIVKLPALLRGDVRVPEQAVRFRELKFDVQCACCSHAKTVCMMGFRVVAYGSEDASGSAKGWRIEAKPISVIVEVEEFWGHLYDKVVKGVDMMMGVALQQARMIELREGFNGFSVQDIQDLAMCFRDESENPRPLVLQEGEVVEEWDDQEAAYLLDV